jgi:hypothetical protein
VVVVVGVIVVFALASGIVVAIGVVSTAAWRAGPCYCHLTCVTVLACANTDYKLTPIPCTNRTPQRTYHFPLNAPI